MDILTYISIIVLIISDHHNGVKKDVIQNLNFI